MKSRFLVYSVFAAVLLLVAGIVAIYTLIENYIRTKKAKKRRVNFGSDGGKIKGYWQGKNKEYDEDLKQED